MRMDALSYSRHLHRSQKYWLEYGAACPMCDNKKWLKKVLTTWRGDTARLKICSRPGCRCSQVFCAKTQKCCWLRIASDDELQNYLDCRKPLAVACLFGSILLQLGI
jgi:hypothetical protein